jgi:group I intron endonuclease
MYQVYEIVNQITGRRYIGMTKNTLVIRMRQHKSAAKRGLKSPLYDAIRSYGVDNFVINLLHTFDTQQECNEGEIRLISENSNLYNLALGGEGGFNITNIEEWRDKLKVARKGRKPALGLKHTEENKKLFAECVKRKPLKYVSELPTSYKEASRLLGISRTHYYRLRRNGLGITNQVEHNVSLAAQSPSSWTRPLESIHDGVSTTSELFEETTRTPLPSS